MSLAMGEYGDLVSLYKFLPVKYAKSLLRDGEIKIGTLHDFRAGEEDGNLIADNSEGDVSVETDFSHKVVLARTEEAESLERFGIYMSPTAGSISFKNDCRSVWRGVKPDMYILCFSSEASLGVKQATYPSQSACVRLVDFTLLCSLVSKHLSQRLSCAVRYVGGGHCVYSDDKEHYNVVFGDEPLMSPFAFVKRTRFAPQKEFRLFFKLDKDIPIKPMVIKDKAIAGCFQKHTL